MKFLVDCVLFVTGGAFGLIWFASVILPLIYGIPKSLWWVARRRLKWWTPLKYLVSPIIFSVITTLVVLISQSWMPTFAKVVFESSAFNMASLFAVLFSLSLSVFSKSTRESMQSDFESFVAPNRIDNLDVFE